MERPTVIALMMIASMLVQKPQSTEAFIQYIIAGLKVANEISSLASNILGFDHQDDLEHIDSSDVDLIVAKLSHITEVVENIEKAQKELKTDIDMQLYYKFMGEKYRDIMSAMGDLKTMAKLNKTAEFLSMYVRRGLSSELFDLKKGATDPLYISQLYGTFPQAFAKGLRCDATKMKAEANQYFQLVSYAVLLETVYNNITESPSTVCQNKNETEMIAEGFKDEIDKCMLELFPRYAKEDLKDANVPKELYVASQSRYAWLCPNVFFYYGDISNRDIDVIGNKTSIYYYHDNEQNLHKFLIFTYKTASRPASSTFLKSEIESFEYNDAKTLCEKTKDLLVEYEIPYSAVFCVKFWVAFKFEEGCDTERMKLYVPPSPEAEYVVYIYFANKSPGHSFHFFEPTIKTDTSGAKTWHTDFVTIMFLPFIPMVVFLR